MLMVGFISHLTGSDLRPDDNWLHIIALNQDLNQVIYLFKSTFILLRTYFNHQWHYLKLFVLQVFSLTFPVLMALEN